MYRQFVYTMIRCIHEQRTYRVFKGATKSMANRTRKSKKQLGVTAEGDSSYSIDRVFRKESVITIRVPAMLKEHFKDSNISEIVRSYLLTLMVKSNG